MLEESSAQGCAPIRRLHAELSAQDAQALPDNFVHFGYHDNIAQPTVEGAPPQEAHAPDDQPGGSDRRIPAGLPERHRPQYHRHAGPLSTNSSYAAFRILEQDVVGFDSLAERRSRRRRASIRKCWLRRCAAAGATATRWSLPGRARRGAADDQIERLSRTSSTDAARTIRWACDAQSVRTSAATTRATKPSSAPTPRIIESCAAPCPTARAYDPATSRHAARAHRLLHQRQPHQPVRVPQGQWKIDRIREGGHRARRPGAGTPCSTSAARICFSG